MELLGQRSVRPRISRSCIYGALKKEYISLLVREYIRFISLVPVEVKPKKQNVTDIIPPVDFSFLKLTNILECEIHEPRDVSPCRNKPAKVKKTEKEGEKKYLSHCLRLNNNNLSEMKDLMNITLTLFDNAANIGWIDLSFNILAHIHPVLTQFENLRILYLHGNLITDLKEVNKLGNLKNLWKLTLHGNEIEKVKGYRFYVLSAIPTLVNLDFSTVTKGDAMTTRTWKLFNVEKPKKIVHDFD
jgi:hypothetical protein